jgi:hypothetical protein
VEKYDSNGFKYWIRFLSDWIIINKSINSYIIIVILDEKKGDIKMFQNEKVNKWIKF